MFVSQPINMIVYFFANPWIPPSFSSHKGTRLSFLGRPWLTWQHHGI